jgi:hypothetical protein
VLTFLAGLVDDATPLIEAVEVEQKNDDLFRSMLYLKARLIGAAGKVDEGIGRRVCDEVFSFWCETLGSWHNYLREFALAKFAPLAANATARAILFESVLQLLEWTQAVNWLEIFKGEAEILELIPPGKDGCLAVAKALGEISDERAVDWLLELTQFEDEDVSDAAMNALAKIGSEQAVDLLLELAEFLPSAINALYEIGHESVETLELSPEVTQQLTQLKDAAVISPAMHAWWEVQDKHAADWLWALMHEDSTLVWSETNISEMIRGVEYFGKIGDKRAVRILLELLTWNVEDAVNWVATKALWQIAWKHKIPIRASMNKRQV